MHNNSKGKEKMSKCITREKAGAFLIETKLCKWLQNVKISVKITVITTEEIFGKQKTKISWKFCSKRKNPKI